MLNSTDTALYVPTVTEKIQRRRYQMLVHSYLYYQKNETIIDDHTFDRWANDLVELQKDYPEESEEAQYYAEFKNFDGSSGYDLPYAQPNIQTIGDRLLRGRNM